MEENSRPLLNEFKSYLRRQPGVVPLSALLLQVLESVSDAILVLDSKQHIVHANSVFLRYVGVERVEHILGLDLGQALQCAPANYDDRGCDPTADRCRKCAAFKVIIEAHNGIESVKEGQLTTFSDGLANPIDVRVRATPFTVNHERFTLFVMSDITAEKRLAALERTFFHDIRNKASVIYGTVEMMLTDDETASDPRTYRILSQASIKLLNEIDAQKQLEAAERGELDVQRHALSSLALLRSVVSLYSGTGEFKRKKLSIDARAEDFLLFSDEALLGRVLENMVKNALEASSLEDPVMVGCVQHHNQAYFWVHNEASIPEDEQSRLFTGSFSTKGHSRGLGTYSMRLLSERYLNGRVKVSSSPESGTTFMAVYPIGDGASANGRPVSQTSYIPSASVATVASL